ncbi:MAG: L,D-transpeptidase family protein [Planctomycetes bacterium]|nr:L,D-transpeptidase family protein [Planctomycetota bacterium]
MALPSQTERQTEIGRSYVYNQRTAQTGIRKAVIAAAVLVLAAGSVWGIITMLNRRSATSTLPPGDTKTQTVANKTGTEPKPVHPATSLASSTPSLTPAGGGTNPTPIKTDAPITPPAGSQTTSTPSPTGNPTAPFAPTTTPGADSSGRPAPVDVTRKDLTPSPAPAPTTSSTPTTITPAGTPGTGSNPSASPSSPGSTTLTPTSSTSEVTQQIQAAEQRAATGDLLGARTLLNKALRNPNAVRDDQERIRQRLAAINADLLFSPKVFAGDPMAEEYVVKSGDNLIKITRNRELAVDWRLIERINGVKGNTLKVGQKLKLVRGPFHAIVHKGDYRLDLFQGSPDDPDSWTFIRSFKVGLGTGNSTPVGSFVIKPKSKLVNPHWVNPQTGQKFDANDPKNPIGEYWMGIEGIGESKAVTGYGLHGTIEPDSIGQQKSMGCVRLGDEDIKLLYEMLVEQFSDVKIVP